MIDVDDERFIPPGDMPARIVAAVASGASGSPMTPGEVTRCILDSLAAAYATTVDAACDLAGVAADAVHVVGGGSQNALLCQLAADRTRRAVVAGPVEATALGNVVVQARARGALPESLDEIRTGLAGTVETVRYEPGADGERS